MKTYMVARQTEEGQLIEEQGGFTYHRNAVYMATKLAERNPGARYHVVADDGRTLVTRMSNGGTALPFDRFDSP